VHTWSGKLLVVQMRRLGKTNIDCSDKGNRQLFVTTTGEMIKGNGRNDNKKAKSTSIPEG